MKLIKLRMWLIGRLARDDIQVYANTNIHNATIYVRETHMLLSGGTTWIGNTFRCETPEVEQKFRAFISEGKKR